VLKIMAASIFFFPPAGARALPQGQGDSRPAPARRLSGGIPGPRAGHFLASAASAAVLKMIVGSVRDLAFGPGQAHAFGIVPSIFWSSE
jgi:hypothetical protein